MTETQIKKIQKQVYDVLFKEQVHNALIIRKREFSIIITEGDLTKARQESIADPDNEKIKQEIAAMNKYIEQTKMAIEGMKLTQQELCEFMKLEMTDKLIELMVLPESK